METTVKAYKFILRLIGILFVFGIVGLELMMAFGGYNPLDHVKEQTDEIIIRKDEKLHINGWEKSTSIFHYGECPANVDENEELDTIIKHHGFTCVAKENVFIEESRLAYWNDEVPGYLCSSLEEFAATGTRDQYGPAPQANPYPSHPYHMGKDLDGWYEANPDYAIEIKFEDGHIGPPDTFNP